MNLILLIPKVIRSYWSRFPEVTNNAYKYFNYDRRVVQERVPRFDIARSYQGPEDLTDADFDMLVAHAKTLVNPVLEKFSKHVACDDALSLAVRSFANGMFDGKVNANRYKVLLNTLESSIGMPPVQAKKKKAPELKPEPIEVKTPVLKQLGLKVKDVPTKERARTRTPEGVPHMYREHGKTLLKKAIYQKVS